MTVKKTPTIVKKKATRTKKSYIKFNIADDLSVTLETVINDKTLKSMVSSEYLTSVDAEDEEVVHIAAIVLASEIVETIIENISGK